VGEGFRPDDGHALLSFGQRVRWRAKRLELIGFLFSYLRSPTEYAHFPDFSS
jgi:hypothetical protein